MSSQFLETADRLGARLCRDAIWANGHCNWTADYARSDKLIGHRALPPDFYDGTSGIALFLHRLGLATGERIFHLTAGAALRQACSKLSVAGSGLYAGGLGILYAQLVIRGEVDAAGVVRQAELNARELDLISGSAGAITVLLAAHRRLPDARLLERAVEHGELLLHAAQPQHEVRRRLTGFSHGAAGRAWALLETHQATGDARFLSGALQDFAYERAHYNPARKNWPDFRDCPVRYMNAWCHGAAGIGLARVRAWELLGELLGHDDLLAEANVALQTVAAQISSMANFSLCHGMAGNADILIYAAQALKRPDLLTTARTAGLEAIERFENRGLPWPCGLAGANELPDLMLGIAGIGHFYLRLHDPAQPSPLLPL